MRAFPIAVAGLAVAFIAFAPDTTHAQMPRIAGPPGSDPGATAAGIARNRRFPFAGVWVGSRHATIGVGTDEPPTPITVRFTVADSAKAVYTGVQLMPGGGKVPFPNAALNGGALAWESPNSGGGTWIYTANLVGRDTLDGRMVLRGAPWKPSPEPTIVFRLIRRAPAAP